jgi:channel protein (hemolysin III family)
MMVELTLYLGMGLAVFGVWSEVTEAFHPGALYLLFGGGAAYVLGVVVFVIGEKVLQNYYIWYDFFQHVCDIYKLCLHTGVLFKKQIAGAYAYFSQYICDMYNWC